MPENINFHFLNVGDGDCTIIEFPSGRIAVVDVCTKNEGTNVVQYLRRNLPNRKDIFRFILTHPHQDHLHGLKELVDEGFSIGCFWHTTHSFTPDKSSDQWEEYQKHWNKYDEIRKTDIIREYKRGNQLSYFKEDGIQILSPCKHLDDDASNLEDSNSAIHRNNYILKITYGNFSAILSGDSDKPCWNHLKEEIPSILPCCLWKAPHHGTENYFDEDIAKLIHPEIIVMSAGETYNETTAFANYRKLTKYTFNTQRHGDVIITGFFDGTWKGACDNNSEDFK